MTVFQLTTMKLSDGYFDRLSNSVSVINNQNYLRHERKSLMVLVVNWDTPCSRSSRSLIYVPNECCCFFVQLSFPKLIELTVEVENIFPMVYFDGKHFFDAVWRQYFQRENPAEIYR